MKNERDVNDARTHLFKELYGPGDLDKPLEKIKSAEPCCLPPCKDVLMQKIKGTHYVTHVWKNAQHSDPVRFCPEGNGWRVQDQQKLEFVWFECKQTPSKIYVDYDETLDYLNYDGLNENESLE